MHVITAEQRAHSRAFDDVIEAADKVLRHPYVQQGLGEIATGLAAINDGAFLPNIRGELISIPKEQQDTEHVAVVPIAYAPARRRLFRPREYRRIDTSYAYDSSVIQPTPLRRQMTLDRMVAHGLEQSEAHRRIEAAFIGVETPYRARLPREGCAHNDYFYAEHLASKSCLTSRPVIMTNFSPRTYSFVERGIIMGHEYAHVPDLQDSAALPNDWHAANGASELHANHIEAEIRLALRAAGIVLPNVAEDRKTFNVELLRREYNPLDDPYATPPEIMEGLYQLGALEGT